MTRAKVLIAIPGDDPPQLQGSPHLERLRPYGEVVLHTDRPATVEEQVRRAKGAVCMINSRSAVKWPGAVLRQLPKLKMVGVCGIGTDSVDAAACRELGIALCNIPGRTAPIVAEHALALMLGCARRLAYWTPRTKAGHWSAGDNIFLGNKLLGIVGSGPIAAATARVARAMGMKVQAWTFHPTPEKAEQLGADFLPLDELLQTSDVVSLHVKLTDLSRGLIGRREIGLMKPGAILVNTARGPVVDNQALAEALQAGRLAGAGVDVFDPEPVSPDDPLLKCEQVILTPHNADQTPEGMDILNGGAVDNVIAFLVGRVQNRVV